MDSFKKILPYLFIAIIFAVGGFLIGKNSAPSEQGASLYKGVSKNTGGIVHLVWANGTCNIYTWDSSKNTWTQLGTLGVAQRDCRDVANNGTLDIKSDLIKSTQNEPIQTLPKDTQNIRSVINLVWANGLGCTVWRWNDAAKNWDSLGVANGVSEKDCKPIKGGFTPPVTAPTSTTPATPSGTTTVKSPVSR
jgi:hypothetical protein